MRAVLDANVLIAALLSRTGAPAQIMSRWLGGEFELVVSDALLAELERALAYPKLRGRVTTAEASELIAVLRGGAIVALDSKAPAPRSVDPGDDYLIALAESNRAVLVTGDRHLLALAADLPIETARRFLDKLEREPRG